MRGAFEDEHPRNMVDASDAYALSVFPFGRDDERPKDYESEIWETGMMVGSGFKVNGSWFMIHGSKFKCKVSFLSFCHSISCARGEKQLRVCFVYGTRKKFLNFSKASSIASFGMSKPAFLASSMGRE